MKSIAIPSTISTMNESGDIFASFNCIDQQVFKIVAPRLTSSLNDEQRNRERERATRQSHTITLPELETKKTQNEKFLLLWVGGSPPEETIYELNTRIYN